MVKVKSLLKHWFYCPYCSNYSTQPMECCGEKMIEVPNEDEKEEESQNRLILL